MAVFTPVSLDEAKEFLSNFEIGNIIHFEGIEEGVSNTNFKVQTDQGLFALTLFETVTPEADLPFFMHLTHYLDAQGYCAPAPIAQKNGTILGRLNEKPCALIKWLTGRWPRHIEALHAHNAGVYLAKLHNIGKNYIKDFGKTRKNSMGLMSWQGLIDACRPKALGNARATILLDEFENTLSTIKNQWPYHLQTGIIHGDYFIDNVLMDDDAKVTGVIDYYYACEDLLALDIAVSLNAWGFTPAGAPLEAIMAAFLDGYALETPLRDDDLKALTFLGMASAMRFTLTRLYDFLNHDPTWLVKPKDPEAFYCRYIYYKEIWNSNS